MRSLVILLLAWSATAAGAAEPPAGSSDPNRTVLGTARDEYQEVLHAHADRNLPRFVPTLGAAGHLVIMGTNTMPDLVNLWTAGYRKFHPQATFQTEAKGSLTGAAPLTEGRSDLATFSREMFPSEVDAFRKKHGYAPLRIRVALGGWRAPDRTGISAIYVHRDNPITRLTLDQLARMFCLMPGREPITTWGQLGLTGEWVARQVQPIGIAMPDGTATFFQHVVCQDADFAPRMRGEGTGQPVKTSVRILSAIAADPGAVGYASLLYENPGARKIAIARTDAGPDYIGSFDETASAQYPLTRFVYLYVNRAPGKPLEPKVAEFLRYVLSLEGQIDVEREGLFLPLPPELLLAEQAKLR